MEQCFFVNTKLHKVLGDSQTEDVKFNKRPAILAFVGVGFVWLWLITGLNTFFGAFGGDVNVLDGNTLLTALFEFQIYTIIFAVIGLAITGWLVGQTARLVPKITDKLPDKAKKF